MPISAVHWRLVVGYNNRSKLTYFQKLFAQSFAWVIYYSIQNAPAMPFVFFIFFLFLLILLSGDVKLNPGPKKKHLSYNFSISHWNLGSLPAHDFSKINSFFAYNRIHSYDLICFSETFLDSSFTDDDRNLILNGYKLYRADHPSNTKKGGVCVYVKESLSIRLVPLQILDECIVLEVTINNKKGIIFSLYRSPSQTADEFDQFIDNLDELLQSIRLLNPSFTILLGDFNAKSSAWSSTDPTTNEGHMLESLASFYGLSQLIKDPTHILPTSSSCIDLIFTDQTSIIRNSGVHSSLHPNCYHQIIFCQLNLKMYYPPPYERVVWNYDKANIGLISRAINEFDWENCFLHKNIDEQLRLFNVTLMNILKNFIPNKVITCDDRDPPWLNEEVKNLIRDRNEIYKSYLRNGRNTSDYD